MIQRISIKPFAPFERKTNMKNSRFTLDDFMGQMGQVQKLAGGSMSKLMGMIPGMDQMTRQMGMSSNNVERQLGRMRGIYHAMSNEERRNPDALDGNRRGRIAAGAGVPVNEVGQFIKQFEQTRDMMRGIGGMG